MLNSPTVVLESDYKYLIISRNRIVWLPEHISSNGKLIQSVLVISDRFTDFKILNKGCVSLALCDHLT